MVCSSSFKVKMAKKMDKKKKNPPKPLVLVDVQAKKKHIKEVKKYIK